MSAINIIATFDRPIPTEEDWGNWKDDLDTKDAYLKYFGKSNKEAQEILRRDPIETADELRFMPDVPFQYYIVGFSQYVVSFLDQKQIQSYHAPDAASCLIGLVKEKLVENPKSILPVLKHILPAVKLIAENQKKYEADASIYGNFMETYSEILELSGEISIN